MQEEAKRGYMYIADYIRLTEPRINLLVVITGFAGMWLAARGLPDTPVVVWGLLGLGLASAGSSVFNNVYDRDIDRLMARTKNRPLPTGRIATKGAFLFGLALSIIAFAVLAALVNTFSAVLALTATAVYSFLYTVLLKRHTPLATEVGGISGALPPVIGWTAVQGTVGPEAFVLFLIMLLWQPPHFWALALKYKDDYRRAGVPVMPVVRSERETLVRSLLYVVALAGAGLLPFYSHMAGRFYLAVSVALALCYVLIHAGALIYRKDWSRLLFRFSIVYLSISFAVMALDMYR